MGVICLYINQLYFSTVKLGKYYLTHTRLNTWNNEFLLDSINPTLADELTRLNYD